MPNTNGTNGNGHRGPNGQFLKGNPGGPGNPNVRKVAKFRTAIVNATSEEDILAVWQKLMSEAKEGKPWAVKELFERLFGKSKATVEVQKAPDEGDPFDLLRDEEVTDALDNALARRATSRPLAEPGCSSN